ncbi:hypothetical protein PMI42_04734 [Bradyrhizobium sp. YR681]|uniref:argonaute/piwi family protein n=1 Tax=Bradyrhizobium sp. YR681 TaxID=1144344 RepID=UPI000270FDEC|nr:hypothetical protein [Bradyrhizobium sp. YR681]EJN11952.1 hypothetical protein PMI42_04734 [Bradyrhizobium sp. YR681]
MKLTHLEEPKLEFGGAFRHPDIRFGIMDYGPFDVGMEGAPKRIKLGIVGSAETVEGTAKLIERFATGFPAKQSRQPNLFPPFPGVDFDSTFRCEFITSNELQRVMPPREIAKLVAIPGQREVTQAIVEAISNEIGVLSERMVKPDVVLVALPVEIIERTYNAREVAGNEDEDETAAGPALDFRGMLKAACMRLRLPIQLLWPTTFDPTYRIPRKLKESSERRTQDPATIAWNLLTATYYKAGGLPWRLARDARQLRTSFVGLSFYKSVDGDHVHTSTAQMFDERGEGLILRGGRMVESEEDRKPHLTDTDAYELLRNSLKVFRDQHGHWPARVVLHKTSRFDQNELNGFHKAIDERDIDYADFVWVQKSMTRLYRLGIYPPLRGTLLRFDKDQALLYTRGSVEFFRTYPGMYVPRPLMLRCQALGQPLQHVAEEMLALTKMNWNNTQFDNGLPITIAAARHVGEVLKYVPEGQEIAPRYSFYM